MQKFEPLEPGNYYHIFNRGVNKENIFKNSDNYAYFMAKYCQYIFPVAETYAYCLLRNHFHFLVRIRTDILVKGDPTIFEEWDFQKRNKFVSNQFSHFFNGYAQAINKQNHRVGGLFQHRFKRVLVKDEFQFNNLVWYIHANPQKHKLVKDFVPYPYSSFQLILGNRKTWIEKDTLLEKFGGKQNFLNFHEERQAYFNSLNNFEESIENGAISY